MRLKIISKNEIDRVEFLDADKIDRTRLAEKLGVTTSMASLMIRTGKFHSKHIPALRKIRLRDVITLRKPSEKKK